jgi:hypothetical protein
MKRSFVSISVLFLFVFVAATTWAHWTEGTGNGGCRTSGETATFSGEVEGSGIRRQE